MPITAEEFDLSGPAFPAPSLGGRFGADGPYFEGATEASSGPVSAERFDLTDFAFPGPSSGGRFGLDDFFFGAGGAEAVNHPVLTWRASDPGRAWRAADPGRTWKPAGRT